MKPSRRRRQTEAAEAEAKDNLERLPTCVRQFTREKNKLIRGYKILMWTLLRIL